MFGLPLFTLSHHARTGGPQWLGEFVATFGLLAVIWGCSRSKPAATPFAVAAYIVGAYWFTSSMSFANPAVTIARSLSDTFAGIRPIDTPGFIIAQMLGAVAATSSSLISDEGSTFWFTALLPRRRSRRTGCATPTARTPISAVRPRRPSATPLVTPHSARRDLYLSSSPTDGSSLYLQF